ncbi:hypothetical protein BKA63DRAFT_561544 [Paraphoma chrysanthemicola]|nr:hypothetical protein BKA63DRAFT_561544 [Paraphoma chrysanthemicola]
MRLTSILWHAGPLNRSIQSMQQKAGLSVKHWTTFRSLVQKECEKIRVTDFELLRDSKFPTMRDLARHVVLAKVNAALVRRKIRPVDEDTAEWATYTFLNAENTKLRRQRIATSWLSRFAPGHTPNPDSAWKAMIGTIRTTMQDLGLLRTAPRYSRSERQQIVNEARRRWRSEYNAPEPDEEVMATLIVQSRSSFVQQEKRKAERRKRATRVRRPVREPDDAKESF